MDEMSSGIGQFNRNRLTFGLCVGQLVQQKLTEWVVTKKGLPLGSKLVHSEMAESTDWSVSGGHLPVKTQ